MKYVFVDMDGVIAEYGYPSGLYDGDFQKGNYIGKKVVPQVVEEILKRYNNENYVIVVCSASPCAQATIEKNEWLNLNFNLPYENRMFISVDEDKVEAIRFYIEDILRGNVQSHTIIIDDKGSVLAKANSLGIECYHPTQLLANPTESSQTEVTEETNDTTNSVENEEVLNNNEVIEGQMSVDELPIQEEK